MKKVLTILGIAVGVIFALAGCSQPTSDDIQRENQEKILAEGNAQTGMPAITNFRERKLLKDILELRDQTGLITYTYIENQLAKVVPGRTALAGKLTYVGESVGYGIPYATQYTNPQKIERESGSRSVIPQADPNGLFSPASAEGTWVLLKDPGGDDTKPVYIEPRIVVSPFKFPSD